MVSASALRSDVNSFINENGVACKITYFTPTFNNSDYDDYSGLAISGTAWTSGLFQPLDKRNGSNDSILLEQGRVKINDSKIYLYGTIQTSGTIKIQVGSPTGDVYVVVNDAGTIGWDINNTPVYKKVYVRYLTNGSILGE